MTEDEDEDEGDYDDNDKDEEYDDDVDEDEVEYKDVDKDDDSDEEDEDEDEVVYEVRKYLRTHPREPGYTRKELLSLIEGIELTSQQWHELVSDGQVVSTGAG